MRRTVILGSLALLTFLAGCVSADSTGEKHWWKIGVRDPKPDQPGSPFSTAATYNRGNSASMGTTIYSNGSWHGPFGGNTPGAPPAAANVATVVPPPASAVIPAGYAAPIANPPANAAFPPTAVLERLPPVD